MYPSHVFLLGLYHGIVCISCINAATSCILTIRSIILCCLGARSGLRASRVCSTWAGSALVNCALSLTWLFSWVWAGAPRDCINCNKSAECLSSILPPGLISGILHRYFISSICNQRQGGNLPAITLYIEHRHIFLHLEDTNVGDLYEKTHFYCERLSKS